MFSSARWMIPAILMISSAAGTAFADLAKHEKVRAMVQEAVDATNAKLPRYETIKKFAIVETDFSVESGDLTPSMKVKRKVVESKFKATIDDFYEGTMQDV